jgi:hypothetical protein
MIIKNIFKWIFSYNNSSINNFGRIMFFLSWLPITLICSSNFFVLFLYSGDDLSFTINYQIFLIVFVSLSYNLFFPRLFTFLAYFITYFFNLWINQYGGDKSGFTNIKFLFPKKFLAPKYEKRSKRWLDRETFQQLSDTHEKINFFLLFIFIIWCPFFTVVSILYWENDSWWWIGYDIFCILILFFKKQLFDLFNWKFLNPKEFKSKK